MFQRSVLVRESTEDILANIPVTVIDIKHYLGINREKL